MDCEKCKNRSISYFIYEAEMSRMEKRYEKCCMALTIVSVLLVASVTIIAGMLVFK